MHEPVNLNWPTSFACRTEDMGTVKRLKITRQGDGDLILSIVTGRGMPLYDRELNLDASVEFCTSGCMSPKTRAALSALYAAMEEDEKAHGDPHRPANAF